MLKRFDKNQLADLAEMQRQPVKERAQQIATLVHENQDDKAGRPYIRHPARVAENVLFYANFAGVEFTQDEEEILRQAAWLHDVIEDSGYNGYPRVSAAHLTSWGIAPEVIQVVELLTKVHAPTDSPAEDPYYQAIKANKFARLVKLADLTDNCNIERTKELDRLDIRNKISYYLSALDFLEPSDREKHLFWVRTNLSTEVFGSQWRECEIEMYSQSMENRVRSAHLHWVEISNDGFLTYYRDAPLSQIWVRGSWTEDGAEDLDKFRFFGKGNFMMVSADWALENFPVGSVQLENDSNIGE